MKQIFLIFSGLFLLSADVFGQCSNNNSFYINLTPSTQGATASEPCIFGGEYVNVNVIAGETYTFSTCNTDPFSGGFDSQITLYNGAGSIVLGYDDDFCAPFSKITWVATYTGTVRVVIDEYNCISGSDCFNLDVTWEAAASCNVGALSSICPTISGNFQLSTTGTDAVITDPNNNWNCVTGAPDAHFFSVEIATSGDLNMTLTGSVDDIDFVIWGPFSSNADAMSHCGLWGTGGANGTVTDCGFTTSSTEYPDIIGAVAGQIYVLVITNFAGVPQTISLTQTGGTGSAASCVALPTVTTTAQSNVTATSATLGGNITSDGGGAITERGIVWSNAATPTVLDNKVQNGSGSGIFSQIVSGLPSNTLIYVRAYAINSGGTSYGNEISFTTSSATAKYVDITASGGNNGTSWANAYTNLQNALAIAVSGDTIFVATGTYKPDGASPGNRNLSFNMKTGVVLMGGFPSGGGPLASRNWVSNPTILSGDIGTAGVHTDNSYHVVRCASQQGELNGFIVERGRADGAAPDNDGGGVFITAGYLTSRFCVYRNNFASDQGGGSYHDAGGNPTYRQCRFENNTAAFGGGSFLFAATFVTNCVYLNNAATTSGGGVYAVVNINMYNNTFRGNSATTSGNAIYYQSGGSNRLFNSIVWGNTGSATHIAGAGSINLRSSIIQGGCPGGGATCTNISSVDPLFADAFGRLSASSPAIDAGDNATGDANSDGLTIDFDNNNRNFDAIPGGTTRDMGAFENLVLNLTQYYVDHTATGSNDGSSWANAFTSFQSAVAAADNGDAVFVATGTHKPSVGVSQRGKTFALKNGVKYYGGFPSGGGTMAQRDFVNNRTILSGDIGVVNVSTDNSYVVVNASGLNSSTLMSGFTVEAGRADSSGFGHPYGQAGGINIGSNGSMRLDSVTVRNNYGPSGAGVWSEGSINWSVNGCIFSGNSPGSGVFISGTNVTGTFTNCEFTGNTGGNGGGLTFNTTTATHTLTNCSFTSNIATGSGGGGGVYGGSGNTQTFTNCIFINNTIANGPGGGFARFAGPPPTFNNCTFTGNSGGGGFGGGAIYSSSGGFNINQCTFRQNTSVGVTNAHGGACYNNGGTCTVTNSLFWNNSTTLGLGGAIYNNTGGTMNVMNCTFAKNNAGGFNQGGGFNNNSTSNASITNCIFWGNMANGSDAASNTEIGHGSGTLNVSNSIWQGNTTGGTIIDVNPLFTNITTGDLTLTACSPAIDAGTATGAPMIDLLSNPRPMDGNGSAGAQYDLGAHEVQTALLNPEIDILGNAITIVDGDVSASVADHTDFGTQSVCSGTIVRTFTIQNTGTSNLTVSSVSVNGSHASDYTVTAQPASSVSVFGSTTFQVTFNPSATGSRNANIAITTNDCDEATYDFAISGLGFDPEVNVQGNSNSITDGDATPSAGDHTDFGSQALCSGTTVRTFTIQNTGTSNLVVGSVSIGGSHAADYTVLAQPGTPVSAAGSTTFQITFDPSASGARNASVSFSTNDCDEATYNFDITGTGLADLMPPSISCPANMLVNTDLGQCSAVVTYTAPIGTDDCVGATTTQIAGLASGATFPVGVTTNTFRVTDAAGLQTTCSFTVTVQDLTPPTAIAQNITVQLDNTGNITITAAQVNNGSSDACGIASLSVFPNSFTCANLGTNNVLLTVTDVNGNISTANAVVTVNTVAFGTVTVNPTSIAINPGQFITFTGSTPLGIIKWYNASNVLVGTGNTYVTPVLNAGTTYTAKASVGVCESPGTVLTVTLKPVNTFGGRKAN